MGQAEDQICSQKWYQFSLTPLYIPVLYHMVFVQTVHARTKLSHRRHLTISADGLGNSLERSNCTASTESHVRIVAVHGLSQRSGEGISVKRFTLSIRFMSSVMYAIPMWQEVMQEAGWD